MVPVSVYNNILVILVFLGVFTVLRFDLLTVLRYSFCFRLIPILFVCTTHPTFPFV